MDKISNLAVLTAGEDVEQVETSRTTYKEEQPLGTLAIFTKADHMHCDAKIHAWAYIPQKRVLPSQIVAALLMLAPKWRSKGLLTSDCVNKIVIYPYSRLLLSNKKG